MCLTWKYGAMPVKAIHISLELQCSRSAREVTRRMRMLGSNLDLRFPQTMPSWFVREHGEKFRKSVLLRTQLSANSSWSVTLPVHFFTPTWLQVKFCGGWKRFATSNGLCEGDWLIFALTAMSECKVYI